MSHNIIVESSALAESLKSAHNYAVKDYDPNNAMCHLLLTYLPKEKKLSVVACDGYGYFERRIPVVSDKKTKMSLPGKEQRICLNPRDCSNLVKLIPARYAGIISLEVEEATSPNKKHVVQAAMPDGSATTFACPTDLEIPDFSTLIREAEKGRKLAPNLSNIHIPIREMTRAGKVFSFKNAEAARVFTSVGKRGGPMAMLESLDDSVEIRVIFMFCNPVAQAA